MPRKPRKHVCIHCGVEFTSRNLEHKYCSKECRLKYRGLEQWSDTIENCETCGKEYKTRKSESGELKNHYCSKSCQIKHINQKYGNGMTDEVKEKISKKLTGVSLKDRGYSDKSIRAWVKAGQNASSDFTKGKKLEEIVGVEKSIEIKKRFSEQRAGDKNSQSLESISKRFNCSIEDARKFTACFGRKGKKHPMYGKHHSVESKKKIVENNVKEPVVQGYFKGIEWQGSWELDFLIFCHEHNIDVKRFDLEPIEYYFEERTCHTWPDFIVNNTYIIEVKGYMNAKSKARIEACEKKFGDEFIVIDKMNRRKETSSLKWINKQKEKYNDMIEITNIPKNIKQEIVDA